MGRKYPVGIQNFAEVREGGYIYVDKSPYADHLKQGKYYIFVPTTAFWKVIVYFYAVLFVFRKKNAV